MPKNVPHPKNMTPEQAAAYVIGTAVGVLGELLAKHWANQASLAKSQGNPVKLPHDAAAFLHSVNRHCVNHDDMLRLFDIAEGKK